jgi:hypothetical protein
MRKGQPPPLEIRGIHLALCSKCDAGYPYRLDTKVRKTLVSPYTILRGQDRKWHGSAATKREGRGRETGSTSRSIHALISICCRLYYS